MIWKGNTLINYGKGAAPVSVTATTGSTEIIPANSKRKFFYLVNQDTTDVYVAVDTTATTDEGILLGKNGGTLGMDATGMSVGAVNGITKTGQSLVLFQEFT